jgi:hypothetical protein
LETLATDTELQYEVEAMSDRELLAAYDEATVSDGDVIDALEEVDYFQYEYRKDLSNEANQNLKNWYDNQQLMARRYVLNSVHRVMMSVICHREIENRGLNGGDLILNVY